MQINASRDVSGKSHGQIASRKKKLARHGIVWVVVVSDAYLRVESVKMGLMRDSEYVFIELLDWWMDRLIG
jgi:hypothetical protein